jgi:hypothetical protein
MKYIVVGGNPIIGYRGTGTFTGLACLACTDDIDFIKSSFNEWYEKCGGLVEIFNTEIGNVVDIFDPVTGELKASEDIA